MQDVRMNATQDPPDTTPSLLMPAPEPFAAYFLDGAQAAALLGVNRGTIYPLIERGTLTRYKIGKLTVFWRPEVERLRDSRDLWYGSR